MSYTWTYLGISYESEALVEDAISDTKLRLENNPTDWVIVKALEGNATDGWIVPSVELTDSEIANLDATKHYSVSSVIAADNDIGLTAADATAKIAEHRAVYADFAQVNSVFKLQQYAPTNVDMSVYTSS